jgi:hypothetical protein
MTLHGQGRSIAMRVALPQQTYTRTLLAAMPVLKRGILASFAKCGLSLASPRATINQLLTYR